MSLQNAMQCQVSNDECRRTARYKVVGQNLHQYCSNPATPIDDVIWQGVNNWFDQYVNIKSLDEVHRLGSTRAPKSILSFTQMVQSKANRIGCSVIQHRDNRNQNCVLIGCNYNVGNLVGYPLYKIGPNGSQCRRGINPRYPGLCSPEENYETHDFADVFFNHTAWPSPVAEQWVRSGRRLDTGHVNPGVNPPYPNPNPNPNPGFVNPGPYPNPNPGPYPNPNPTPYPNPTNPGVVYPPYPPNPSVNPPYPNPSTGGNPPYPNPSTGVNPPYPNPNSNQNPGFVRPAPEIGFVTPRPEIGFVVSPQPQIGFVNPPPNPNVGPTNPGTTLPYPVNPIGNNNRVPRPTRYTRSDKSN